MTETTTPYRADAGHPAPFGIDLHIDKALVGVVTPDGDTLLAKAPGLVMVTLFVDPDGASGGTPDGDTKAAMSDSWGRIRWEGQQTFIPGHTYMLAAGALNTDTAELLVSALRTAVKQAAAEEPIDEERAFCMAWLAVAKRTWIPLEAL